MNVDILDFDVFNAIDPTQVERYLDSKNWIKKRILPNDVSIWDYEDVGGDRHRIWLPETTDLADYPEAMARVVRAIATAENRSQLRLLDDFETEGIGDVVRLGSYDELNRHSGSLQFADGEALIQQSRDMVISAALSTQASSVSNNAGHRAVFSTGRPRKVQELDRSLRLGQTEHGSYTIKLIVPISEEEIRDSSDSSVVELPGTPEVTPFSRQSVMKLATGLDLLYDIGREADKTGKYYFQPFVEGVPRGISANLCDAVANVKHTSSNKPLAVSISWSYLLNFRTPSAIYNVEFPPDYMPFYREASRDFRQREPEIRTLSGFVRVLQRDHDDTEGVIGLSTIVDGNARLVRMRLSGDDYQQAVRSHMRNFYISISGELDQRGPRSWWLVSPGNLMIEQSLSLLDDD